MIYFLLLLSFLFGFLRFVVPVSGKVNKHDIFKDLAHIFVGILIGYGFYKRESWFLAVALTATEVIAFFARKKVAIETRQMSFVINGRVIPWDRMHINHTQLCLLAGIGPDVNIAYMCNNCRVYVKDGDIVTLTKGMVFTTGRV